MRSYLSGFSLSKLLILSFFLTSLTVQSQNSVVIGGTTPNPNAVLLLVGNGAQGLIIPITTDHTTISKVQGMVVYNSTDKTIYYCNGTTWATLGGSFAAAGAGISITGSTITNTGDVNAADDITTATAATGDLSGNYPSVTIGKIKGVSVASTAPTLNQVLQFNGTSWTPTTLATGLTNPLTTQGDLLVGGSSGTPSRLGGSTGFLKSTGAFLPTWTSINLASTDVSGSLGLTNGGTGAINAAGARTNLGLGSLSTLNTITSTEITDGTLTDADVNASASIAGDKIKPNFGAQTIATTGQTSFNSVTNTWPGTQGVANTFLRNDGTGALSWAPISGFSTLNSIPKGNGSILVASQIFDDGTNVGIGNSSPAYKLDVFGTALIRPAIIGSAPYKGTSWFSMQHQSLPLNDISYSFAQSKAGYTMINTPSDVGNNYIDFKVDDVSKMRMLENGYLGIGTTAPSAPLHVVPNSTSYAIRIDQGVNGHGLLSYVNTTSAARIVFSAASNVTGLSVFGDGTVGIGTGSPTSKLSVNGSADKIGGGSWGTFSDRRLKKDIHTFNDGLNVLLKINPVQFKYNGLGGYDEDGKNYVGIIAQDVAPIAPYMISTVNLKLNKSDVHDTGVLKYDGSALTYILVNSIKEQQLELDSLKAYVKDLNAYRDKTTQEKNGLEARLKVYENQQAEFVKDIDELKRILGAQAKTNKLK